MPSNGSTTCAGCEFDCSATAFFSKSRGESPTSSDGPTPYAAEYVALTRLQADAFVTLDEQLAGSVQDLVAIAPIEALS